MTPAQEQADDATFLPRPWQLRREADSFGLDAATRIQIGPAARGVTAGAARNARTALEWLTAQSERYSDGEAVDAVIVHESWRTVQRLIHVIGVDALPEDIRGWRPARFLETTTATTEQAA